MHVTMCSVLLLLVRFVYFYLSCTERVCKSLPSPVCQCVVVTCSGLLLLMARVWEKTSNRTWMTDDQVPAHSHHKPLASCVPSHCIHTTLRIPSLLLLLCPTNSAHAVNFTAATRLLFICSCAACTPYTLSVSVCRKLPV